MQIDGVESRRQTYPVMQILQLIYSRQSVTNSRDTEESRVHILLQDSQKQNPVTGFTAYYGARLEPDCHQAPICFGEVDRPVCEDIPLSRCFHLRIKWYW
jgi:hypothetical protein